MRGPPAVGIVRHPAGRHPTAGVISELAESESENCIEQLIEIRDNKKAPLALRKRPPFFLVGGQPNPRAGLRPP
jgi:hypothetical protein